MSSSQQSRLFGRTFEEIDHSRRLGILELLSLIDSDTGNRFKEMSGIRNKYLHRLSQSHDEMSKDAKRSYDLAVQLAVRVLGLRNEGRRVHISEEVLTYIRTAQNDTSLASSPQT